MSALNRAECYRSQPQACVARSFALFNKTRNSSDGTLKVLQVATKMMQLTGSVFSKLSEVPQNLLQHIKVCADFLDTLDLLGRIEDWVNWVKKPKQWRKTVSLVCQTIGQFFGLFSFLESIKAMKWKELLGKIGDVPVISMVGSIFTVVGFSISSIDEGITIYKTAKKTREVYSRIERLRIKEEAAQAIENGTFAAQHLNLAKRYRQAILADRVNRVETDSEKEAAIRSQMRKWNTTLEKLRSPEKHAHTISRIVSRITKHQVNADEIKFEQRKALLNIAFNIAKVVAGILTLIGLFAGIAALTSTGLPMLAIGTVSASITLFKFLYTNF